MLQAYYRGGEKKIFHCKFNYDLTTSPYKFCDVKISWADSNHTLNRTDEASTYAQKCPGLERHLITG